MSSPSSEALSQCHDAIMLSAMTFPEQFRVKPERSTIPGTASSSSSSSFPTLLQCTLAGAIGGVVGDTSMHSLDTVKTRQQAAPHIAKYRNTLNAYLTILKEEGFARGLYSGYSAAMMGSLPSSAVFFFAYESVKRVAIEDFGFNDTASYLGAGFVGDLVSSVFYVPSEVLKTRLQLQGRYNNPYYNSGYNYRGLFDAANTIVRTEGWKTLFFGYRATLFRDLPFSALQFTFYENFRNWAFTLSARKKNDDPLPTSLEMLTGAAAGGLSGILTTPCDVVKTRMQTQNVSSGNVLLKSNSLIKNLLTIYKSQGVAGLFNGVGPRFVWTSAQSSIMLLLYQLCLRTLSSDDITFE
ncbi:hypothetical protein FOA43_003241 [Brettanomyces nanus]|uniref:Mitochondrial carrier protein n=1 Tax=Eeniella nana TaxID=13502 RepID=A0A875RVW1_EENNA|nr:uncharacterized protein FOA43_003241 [Brettanomyces nanus]QPG75857.1 hypothetical protein FOA43_003241 [Brettanomyces nanus]